jgi:uncharacterized protein YbaA (DUF1428 family)
MSYVDGFIVPVPQGNTEQYRQMAEKMAGKCRELGALHSIEGWGDDVQHGKVTDFYRAVNAQDGENVVFSFIIWPDKQTRDAGWEKLMADPEMQPGSQPMPFDGKRMFWGGFTPFVEVRETVSA